MHSVPEPSLRAWMALGPDANVLEQHGETPVLDVLQSLVSSLNALGDRALVELGAGRLRRLVLDGDAGRVGLVQRRDGVSYVALVERDAPLGAVFALLEERVMAVAA